MPELRPTLVTDGEALFAIARQPGVRRTYPAWSMAISTADVVHSLLDEAAFCLTVLVGQEIAGVVRLYGYNVRDSTGRVSVIVDSRLHRTGAGVVAVAQLLEIGFAEL